MEVLFGRGTELLKVKKQGSDTPGRKHSRDKDTEEGQAAQGKLLIRGAGAGGAGMTTAGRSPKL